MPPLVKTPPQSVRQTSLGYHKISFDKKSCDWLSYFKTPCNYLEDGRNRTLNQAPLLDQLARQRIAELHDMAGRERLAARTACRSRSRVYAGRMLIALGTRLAPTETRATNRVTEPAEP